MVPQRAESPSLNGSGAANAVPTNLNDHTSKLLTYAITKTNETKVWFMPYSQEIFNSSWVGPFHQQHIILLDDRRTRQYAKLIAEVHTRKGWMYG